MADPALLGLRSTEDVGHGPGGCLQPAACRQLCETRADEAGWCGEPRDCWCETKAERQQLHSASPACRVAPCTSRGGCDPPSLGVGILAEGLGVPWAASAAAGKASEESVLLLLKQGKVSRSLTAAFHPRTAGVEWVIS